MCICQMIQSFTVGNRITSGGSVYVLSLSDPLVLHSPNPVGINLGEIASCRSYIWTADCNFNGSRALIGKFIASQTHFYIYRKRYVVFFLLIFFPKLNLTFLVV